MSSDPVIPYDDSVRLPFNTSLVVPRLVNVIVQESEDGLWQNERLSALVHQTSNVDNITNQILLA
jgi:hypothetical protein